jgi:hypothetical protein
MKILMETLPTDVDTKNQVDRCPYCPHEYYLEIEAHPDQKDAEKAGHLCICPGRQAYAQAA